MKRINWSSAIVTALVAYVVGFAAFLALFGNPVVRNIIYTPQAGQSDKLLAMWLTLEPLPAVGPFWERLTTFGGRTSAVAGLLLLWAFGLVLIYATVAEALPGEGWRKGVLPFQSAGRAIRHRAPRAGLGSDHGVGLWRDHSSSLPGAADQEHGKGN